jgi:hypothetical protein
MMRRPLDVDTALNMTADALAEEGAQIVAVGTAWADSGQAEADTTDSRSADPVSVDVRRSFVEEESRRMVD